MREEKAKRERMRRNSECRWDRTLCHEEEMRQMKGNFDFGKKKVSLSITR